jgi:signal transduction histidine kinase
MHSLKVLTAEAEHAPSPAVLIVDDHSPNLLAMEAVLAPLGYRLLTAASGNEALELARVQDIATILIDVHMAGLDGYQTMALLRNVEPLRDVPVIFVTAVYDDARHRHRGYALGAVDFIAKPIDGEVLRAKVHALVSLYLRAQRIERMRGQERDRLKNLFLGAVGHDLRNPLNSVLMAARILEATSCSEESHRARAQAIAQACQRMTGIIENILDLTRGEFAGTVPITLEPADLGMVSRAVVEELRITHPQRVLEIEVVGDVSGHWDGGRLARVVSNLVGNALQHSSAGPVRVGVLDEGHHARLVVHNGGEPIREEILPHLFQAFRGDDARAGRLGLGLYIVKEIVHAHRGEVSVSSTAIAGTSFAVRLPKNPRIPAAGL